MKVAIVHNYPIHYKHRLFNELAKADDIQFTVLFLSPTGEIRSSTLDISDARYAYSMASAARFPDDHSMRPSRQAFRFIRFVWGNLSKIKPDIVISGGWSDWGAWAGWLWAQLHGCPVVLWAETNSFDRPRRAWRELAKVLFVRRCLAAQVYGESCAAYLDSLGLPRAAILIKRAVIDTQRLERASKKRNLTQPRRLLYVGRLSDEKNLPFLITGFAKLLSDRGRLAATLVLLGDGPLRPRLEQLAADLQLADVLTFRSGVPHEEMYKFYESGDVLVLPSTREPYGLVALEALSASTPVAVSSRCGCFADLPLPEVGWHFSPFDMNSLLATLHAVCECAPQELAAKGLRGRQFASDYSPERCSARIRAHLQHVTAM